MERVAALEGPQDDGPIRLCSVGDVGFWCVCVLKCQNEPAEIALQNAIFRTRQFKTIPRNTPRYSYGILGHCESAIGEVEKQIRAMLFQMHADHNRNSDKLPARVTDFSRMVRHVAWTLTRYALKSWWSKKR